jgi:hypothetical protein
MTTPRIDQNLAIHVSCLAATFLIHIAADQWTHLIGDLVPALAATVLFELEIAGSTSIVASFMMSLAEKLQIDFFWALLAAFATELPVELGLLLRAARVRKADEQSVAQKSTLASLYASEQRSLAHPIGS